MRIKKVFEPLTKSIKDVSDDVTRAIMETSVDNNKAQAKFSDKIVEIMNDMGKIATYVLLPLSKITNSEHTFQLELVNDQDWNRVNDLLIKKTIPVTLYDNSLTFRDTDRNFELNGHLLKMITNRSYKTDLAESMDRNLLFDFKKWNVFWWKSFR